MSDIRKQPVVRWAIAGAVVLGLIGISVGTKLNRKHVLPVTPIVQQVVVQPPAPPPAPVAKAPAPAAKGKAAPAAPAKRKVQPKA
jgi:hypothetical protein